MQVNGTLGTGGASLAPHGLPLQVKAAASAAYTRPCRLDGGPTGRTTSKSNARAAGLFTSAMPCRRTLHARRLSRPE